MFRFKHKLPKHSGIIFLVSTLYTLVFAVASPVFPLFIKQLVGQDMYVGLVVALSSVEWIIFTIMMSYFLKKIKKAPLTKIALAGFALCYAIIPLVTTLWQFLILDLFRSLFAAGATVTLGLFIRDVAGKKNLGKVEGLYFTLINIAWFAGPLAGGFVAAIFSKSVTFSLAAIIAAIALCILMVSNVKEKSQPVQSEESMITRIKDFFSTRNLTIIYLIAIGLATWWTVLYTYVPLFITEHGFTEKAVGITLALFTIPLIIFDFIAGWLADKYGYRRFLASAFLIMAILLMVAAFTQNVYLFIGLIVTGCLGAAFIEPLHEAYFFHAVSKKSEMRFYPVFRTGYEVGYLIAPLIFSGIMFLSSGSFYALFLVAALMMFFFCLMAVLLRKIKKKGDISVIVETSEKEIG
ncbi:MAG: MFS transporter [Nanoarchaeota archaeon]|nr:MFS transporter [Nanoarchaeota archaeon]